MKIIPQQHGTFTVALLFKSLNSLIVKQDVLVALLFNSLDFLPLERSVYCV